MARNEVIIERARLRPDAAHHMIDQSAARKLWLSLRQLVLGGWRGNRKLFSPEKAGRKWSPRLASTLDKLRTNQKSFRARSPDLGSDGGRRRPSARFRSDYGVLDSCAVWKTHDYWTRETMA